MFMAEDCCIASCRWHKIGWLKTLACIGVFVEWLGQVVSEKSALEAIWRLHKVFRVPANM